MVVDKRRLGQGRTGGRLHRIDIDLSAVELVQHKGEGQTGKVASTPGAADDHIGIFPHFFELFLGLQADDRLVEQYMIQKRCPANTGSDRRCRSPLPQWLR